MSDARLGLYGELDEALNWSCCFMASATDPACMAPATWHGVIVENNEFFAMMSSCEEHRPFMAKQTKYVHELGSACALPGSWLDLDQNFCFMPEMESLHGAAIAMAEA